MRNSAMAEVGLFSKLLGLFGSGAAEPGATQAADPYAPYAQPSINQIYNLLFCDDLSAYKPRAGQPPAPWQSVLFSEPASDDAIRALADDASAESRVRVLAYNLLRMRGKPVPEREMLGVILEVALDGGLDVVAAYIDGGVRYINQSGKMIVVEGQGALPEIQPVVSQLLDASKRIVAAIGPWDKARLPPPSQPNIRLNFLVSDGLYFGQGPMSVMANDAMAGPLIQHALHLVQILTRQTTERK